jgi:hypothetical protein
VFDALIHRQDRNEPGAGESTMVVEALQRAHHARRAIGLRKHAVNEIGSRKMKLVPGDSGATIIEQRGLLTELLSDGIDHEFLPFAEALYTFESSSVLKRLRLAADIDVFLAVHDEEGQLLGITQDHHRIAFSEGISTGGTMTVPLRLLLPMENHNVSVGVFDTISGLSGMGTCIASRNP